MSAYRIVVMGVAGAGKSTVGRELADRLGARFVDADDVHPPSNVTKMAAGLPLTDADRRPWLDRLRLELAVEEPVVVTCSALAGRYRDALRAVPGVRFVFLDVTPAVAESRVAARLGHFMPPSLVADQFATLERPTGEADVNTIDADAVVGDVVDAVAAALDVG